jgi:hypothetical protein
LKISNDATLIKLKKSSRGKFLGGKNNFGEYESIEKWQLWEYKNSTNTRMKWMLVSPPEWMAGSIALR